MDHIVKLAGIRHVGLDLDLCDSFKNYLSVKSALATRDVIQGNSSLSQFAVGLIQRGCQNSDIVKIQGANFMRAFESLPG